MFGLGIGTLGTIWSAFGKQIVIVGAVALLAGGVWLHGYAKGKDNVQRKWDAATQAEIARGNKARADAVRSVTSGRVRSGADPWNRNR